MTQTAGSLNLQLLLGSLPAPTAPPDPARPRPPLQQERLSQPRWSRVSRGRGLGRNAMGGEGGPARTSVSGTRGLEAPGTQGGRSLVPRDLLPPGGPAAPLRSPLRVRSRSRRRRPRAGQPRLLGSRLRGRRTPFPCSPPRAGLWPPPHGPCDSSRRKPASLDPVAGLPPRPCPVTCGEAGPVPAPTEPRGGGGGAGRRGRCGAAGPVPAPSRTQWLSAPAFSVAGRTP